MEDARFDPGSIDASAIDVGRMMLVSFATVYGNDWFVVPVRLPVATLSAVTSFTVTDVFGRPTSLGRAGEADDGWNLFGLSDLSQPKAPGGERPTVPWFFLAPALPDWLEGPPAESVLLLRDERANLAWAIEAAVSDDAGGVLDRIAREAARPRPVPAPATTPRYRVQTSVPENWYPLAPEQIDRESVFLRLVPLARSGERGRPDILPIGRLLAPDPDDETGVWLFEEEIPRSGATVQRTHQRARWHDGSVHSWTTRSKRHGRGEGSSGLQFDIVEPADPGP
jgi:hypothetical protein